ncbi:MAG: putative GNAT family N-acyltransferase [Roseivirga sp.]|jgi:predicted GNAT family N-acyltransferase
MMMIHFIQQAKDTGYESIVLDSEPKVEKFYQNFGFKVIGQLESSIKNRYLPIMELKI